jgi:hypothetical protein
VFHPVAVALMLTGLLATILMRVLKSDLAKFTRIDEGELFRYEGLVGE